MDRLTRSSNNNEFYVVDHATVNSETNGYSGEAINRLGRFEDFYEDLVSSQIEVPKELEKLRNEGKEKSYRYKELMTEKFSSSHILGLLKVYGI